MKRIISLLQGDRHNRCRRNQNDFHDTNHPMQRNSMCSNACCGNCYPEKKRDPDAH